VLEHVFNPDDFLNEVNRVLKPSGKLLLTVPFVWDEHEQPYDYARYSSFGLRSLLEKHGFSIVKHEKVGGGTPPFCSS
jgi:SAM-dependent methyltransferase